MWGVVSGFDARLRLKVSIPTIAVYCALVMVVPSRAKVSVSCLFFVHCHHSSTSLHTRSLVCLVYSGIDTGAVDPANYLHHYTDSSPALDVLGVVKLNLGRYASHFPRLIAVGSARLGWLAIELLTITPELVVEDARVLGRRIVNWRGGLDGVCLG